jgi:Mn-dependent DtxR family transcriptional regulator
MDYLTYARKLDYIKWLAERKATGGRKDLATKMDVSVSTVKRMIRNLRTNGTEIKYCRMRRSYVLEN